MSGNLSVYELAYEEGKAALTEQSVILKETRDRAGTIASAAAVVAGLGISFGVTSDKVHKLSSLSVIGAGLVAASFVVLVVAAVMVWRPFEGVFTLDPRVIIGGYAEGPSPADLAETHREVALHLGNHVDFNGDRIQDRLRWFSVLLFAFLAEVVFLMATLVEIAR